MRFPLIGFCFFVGFGVGDQRLPSAPPHLGDVIAGHPDASCTPRFMRIILRTATPLHGRIYVEGRENDRRCLIEFAANHTETTLRLQIPILPCAIIEEDREDNEKIRAWVYLRVNFHRHLITGSSRVFRLECSDLTKAQILDDTENGPVNTICRHEVRTPQMPFRVGGILFHEWTCTEQYGSHDYIMFLRECIAISKTKDIIRLVDHRGCIVDDTLISNLHSPLSAGPQTTTALSQIFKFAAEDEIRFRCKILLIPRSIDSREHFEIGKCGDSKDSKSDVLRLPQSNGALVDVIETMTLTDWIRIEESEQVETTFGGTLPDWESDESLLTLNDLYNSRRRRLFSHEIADIHPITLNYEDYATNSDGESIFDLYNSSIFNVTATEDWVRVGQNGNHDWRLDDLVLNRTDETILIVACANHTNRYNLTLPLRTKYQRTCSWHLLSTGLLIWCIGSVLIWLCILGYKLYRFLWYSLRDDLADRSIGFASTFGTTEFGGRSSWFEQYDSGMGGGWTPPHPPALRRPESRPFRFWRKY